MAFRYVRNTAILVKSEVTYALDPVPVGATDAMLVSNLSINPLNAQNVDRDNIRPFFGNNEELVGTKYVQCGFDIELAGSGTAGTPPPIAPLLLACCLAETVNAAESVEYTPITNNQGSCTIYWHDDGLLHKITGAKGTFVMKMGISQRPVFTMSMTGLYNAPTAVANPTVVLTGFQKPLVITDQNTMDVMFGGTYAASEVTGGTTFPSRGIEMTLGNDVPYIPLLGGDAVDITNRQATMKVELSQTAAEEAAQFASMIVNTTQSVSLEHGLVAGNTVLLFLASVQLINPSKADQQGRRLTGADGRVVPVLGNDEFIICFK